ncbi:MAG TPA: AtpZ/AtpI family protein [Anaerolineales bacterium]|nr:AtpZ/AtpI family protein [Anaerolineales bacterium]
MTGAGQGPRQDQASLSLTLVGLIGQSGCVTLVIIATALVGGLWLDGQFDSKPLFTLLLVLGSVPVTLYLMVRILTSGLAKLQSRSGNPTLSTEMEDEVGEES